MKRDLGLLERAWNAALVFLIGLSASAVLADEPNASDKVSYFRQIRPLFQTHCVGCHQPAKRGGDYLMSDFAALVQGGESEQAAIVPGKPDESYLFAQIRVSDGEAEMPKGRSPLAADEIALVRRWIEEGAADDSPASTRPRYTMDSPPKYEAPPVITSLAYSPDGQHLAISGYHETVIRSADGQQVLHRLVGLSERIQSIAYSPDGKALAVAGGSPGRLGELQVWDLEGEPSLRLTVATGYDTLYGASWSPDGRLVGYGCPDNTTRAIEAATGEEVLFNGAHDDWVLDTVFSVKGDHIVTVSRDQSMKLMNVETQRFIDNITSITPGALKGGLHAVARHPSQDQLLCGGADGEPKIYKMIREKARKIGDDFNLIRKYAAMEGRVFDVAFSENGEQIVAGSSLNGAGSVRVYQTNDAKQIMEARVDGGVYAVAFHPDGATVAAGGFDGRVRLLDAKTGKLKSEFHPIELVGAE